MRKYIIYDMRACPREHLPEEAKEMIKTAKAKNFADVFFPGDTDEATIFELCDTLEEVEEAAGEYGTEVCVFQYAVKGKTLIKENYVGILREDGIIERPLTKPARRKG